MIRSLCRLGTLILAAGLMVPALAQAPQAGGKEKVEEAKPSQARGDAKLPDTPRANRKDDNTPAPPEKGGAKPRGSGICRVHVDNRTRYIMRVWVDGQYQGLMGAFGDLFVYAIAGGTRLQAQASFDDGSVLNWGPSIVNCPEDGTYRWRLTP